MKRSLLIVSLLLLCGSLKAQEWPTIQPEALPGARWWWLGSAVDEANLTYNLEEYAKAGLGGVEITPIYGVQGNDQNDIPYLSKRWMEVLQHTVKEGKRVGIEVTMNNGTGWPFGGPNVAAEDAASKALFTRHKVQGGRIISLPIEVEDEKQRPVAQLSRVMAYNRSGQCLNLTKQVKQGVLRWNAPVGEWELIVLHVGKTLQKVKRAAPGGEGLVMNHLDKGAVKRYLATFDKAFKEHRTNFPHTFFNDSYEVYGADWTPDFLEQFARRRGYRLEEHFPAFLAEERNEETARIVSDYRETISDLLIENFSTQWTDWAHRHGSITRSQAHGSPANLIDTYASVDIPECEGFGLSQFHIKGLRQDALTRKNDSDLSMLKYASSAAHIAGKPYTSSETFTWLTEHFRTSLAQCKPDMDLMFVSGVNHMYFHGTPYSPREARWPGWKFYASIDMSPTNSIWRDAPAFFDYIARCQSFLQMGKPDNDFLVYLPVYDMWQEQPGRLLMFSIHDMAKRAPKFIKTVHTISNLGYDMDYISDRFIQTTRCENGKLLTEGGTAYKAIIIPAVKLMPTEVLKHLLELARAGATLIFTENYPEDVPGYGKLESRRSEFARVKSQLPTLSFDKTVTTPLEAGTIITGSDYASALRMSGIAPEMMKTHYGLQCIRRSNETGHHYFISSLQEKGVDGWVELAVDAEGAMIFDPMTGEKGRAQMRKEGDKTLVRLQLHSGESTILQTFDHKLPDVAGWEYTQAQPISLQLDHGWQLHFAASTPAIEGEFEIDSPTSWTTIDHPAATITMATGVYTNTFTLPRMEADEWILDLSDVRESARVRINGKEVGTAWAVPYRLKVGQWLKTGENTIEIEVTNLPANRIADMDRRGEEWRIFKEINVVNLQYQRTGYSNWEPMPSGLNSPVKLIPVNFSVQ
ncbi:MAG: glycosyl hydrolase family 2 [Alistipes sp.]|nr:glycosyl hydrolase family 2 [Alistipes sp.]